MSPRASFKRGDRMHYGLWLVFDAMGNVRMTRTEPNVGRGERMMHCELIIPLSLFRVPTLKAQISVGDATAGEFKIDVEAAAEALKAVLGVDVDFRVELPDAD